MALSDHSLVTFKFNIDKHPVQSVTYTARDLQNFGISEFTSLLNASDIMTRPLKHVDDFVAQLNNEVVKILDKLAPLCTCTKRVAAWRSPVWLTPAANDAERYSRRSDTTVQPVKKRTILHGKNQHERQLN